jgi:hypothetical protein
LGFNQTEVRRIVTAAGDFQHVFDRSAGSDAVLNT